MDTCVVDLGFGDSGKGTTVDVLASKLRAQKPLVVRYNGGPQAAHNVVVGGLHHTFASYGSGSLAGAPTLVSRFTYVNPILMKRECGVLIHKANPSIFIDERCPVMTAYHAVMNRSRETARGRWWRHGSTGHGIGEMSRLIETGGPVARVKDFTGKLDNAVHILTHLRAEMVELISVLGERVPGGALDNLHPLQWLDPVSLAVKIQQSLRSVLHHGGKVIPSDSDFLSEWSGPVLYEGAQGILLDQLYGFNPYTTWTDTTPANALTLASEADRGTPHVLGVIRSYMTRHGAGPFPTEGTASRHERHNQDGDYVGQFRVGLGDLVLWKYAAGIANIDGLAVTHMDVCPDSVCVDYPGVGLVKPRNLEESMLNTKFLGRATPTYTAFSVGRLAGELAPVVMRSYGPDRSDKFFGEVSEL